jgi:hypothetical protein
MSGLCSCQTRSVFTAHGTKCLRHTEEMCGCRKGLLKAHEVDLFFIERHIDEILQSDVRQPAGRCT